MTKKIFLFFLIFLGLISKAKAENVFLLPFFEENILAKLEEILCSKPAILFLAFALFIAYVRLFPPKEQKEEEEI